MEVDHVFVTIDLIKREDGEERQKEREGVFGSQSKRIRGGDVVKRCVSFS
jgi:hypothetical protein